jgi:thioesterase domain-containing protein/NAD(P)-dependent dehydrogenase (short-subunit alcohol dehydrogenase family)/acyl carrier protein
VADQRAYLGAIHLARALADAQDQSDLCIVTTGAYRVGTETIRPSRRLATAPALVVPHELPDTVARFVDVENPSSPSDWSAIATELLATDRSPIVALRKNGRWRQGFSPIKLDEPTTKQQIRELRSQTVIAIAGGLGGIALAVAQHWAKQQKALRFAFMSRKQFPSRAEWPDLLAQETSSAPLKAQLQALLAIEEAGSEIMVVSADVCDRPSLEAAARQIRDRFGAIDVVVQAAGLIEDGPFQTKSDRQILKVLAPKVQGTANLQATMGREAKLFLMFSSVASFLGLPGQIDYAAANAYLDALADSGPDSKGSRWISVGWNAWRNVGMVADKLSTGGVPPLPPGTCKHPLLAGYEANATGHRVASELSVDAQWLLQEHRILGGAHLIPGTGFIELIRAAHEQSSGQEMVELSAVNFLAPLQVAEGQKRRLEISFVRAQGGYEVSLRSLPGMTEHVSAYVSDSLPKRPTIPLDLKRLKASCSATKAVREGGFLPQDFVQFGPRWGNIVAIMTGENEALIQLELAEAFAGDLSDYKFHPAVMDMATGGAQHLISGFRPDEDFFVPLAYEEIRFFAPLTRCCFSHVRISPKSQGEIAVFDVTIADPEGRRLIEIEGFTMKRVSKEAAIVQNVSSSSDQPDAALEELVREAILPEEGVLALDRVLHQNHFNHVVTSSVDVNLWLTQLERGKSGNNEDDQEQTFERPDLGVDYVAPEGSLEKGIAEIWSKLLGVEAAGANDEFFALGGDSLVAVRFFAKVKKQWGVSLPISTLFQAPTIRALGKVLQERGVAVEYENSTTHPAGPEFVPFRELREKGDHSQPQNSPSGRFKRCFNKVDSSRSGAEYVGGGRTWLVFLDDAKVGELLKKKFSESGDAVICVRAGDVYHRSDATNYTVTPERGRDEMARLVADLKEGGTVPSDIVHMWLLTEDASFRRGSSFFHRTQEQGCFALLSLFQAIADAELDVEMRVSLITNSVYVSEDGPPEAEGKATALGPLATAPFELPRVRTRHIDVALKEGQSAASKAQLAEQIVKTLTSSWDGGPFLIRGNETHRVGVTNFEWETPRNQPPSHDSTYLFMGELTLHSFVHIAKTIVKQPSARFAWIRDTRSPQKDTDEAITAAFKSLGINLEQSACDLTNREQLRAAMQPFTSSKASLHSIIVGSPPPERELMQLLDDGTAEDLLALEVLAASLVTELARQYLPNARILFVAKAPESNAGETILQAGAAFLERHVLRCRQLNQNASILFSTQSGSPEDLSDLEQCLKCQLSDTRIPSATWALKATGAQQPLGIFEHKVQASGEATPTSSPDADLISLFSAAAGVPEYPPGALLRSFGADRLDAARLATHLKHRYHLPQPVRELVPLSSPELFSQFLELQKNAQGSTGTLYKYLVPIHSGEPGSKKPFFLVAGMFGNILNLRHLGRLLGTNRPVYGIQARGLFGEAPPYETIEEMAEAYLKEVLDLYPTGPIALGGFSGGGLTAYEMARTLREQGRTISSLIMLDTPFPQHPEISWHDRLTVQKLRLRREGVKYVGDWVKNRAAWEVGKLKKKLDPRDTVYEEGSFQNDAVQQSFIRAATNFHVKPYPGKLTLYRPALDTTYEVSPGRYLNSDREIVRPDQGWTGYVEELEICEVPGDHDHMVLEPEVRVLADFMTAKLAEDE